MTASQGRSKIAVIGGGLTGLATAHRLLAIDSQLEVTVFEARQHCGGHIATQTQPGFLIERGADSFITNKPAAVELCRELGIEDQLIPTNDTFRRSLVLRNGRPTPVPSGFSLLTPTELGPIFRSSLFSLRGKLRIAAEQIVSRTKSTEEESLASFVKRRFGCEAFERLVQPLVGGIYTADPDRLSLAATLPRFIQMEKQHGSLIKASRIKARTAAADQKATGARYGLFATFRNGFSQLFSALRDNIQSKGGTIETRCPVKSLRRADSGWDVETATGCQRFDGVIITTATHAASRLLNSVDRQLASALDQIEYASTAVVVTAHPVEHVSHPADAFGLVIPAIEKRRILAVSFSSRKFPGRAPDGQLLMRTFVGGATQPQMLKHSDDELVSIVREELNHILGVSGEPTLSLVTRYDKAMPQYHIGHVGRVTAIEASAASIPGLELAGSAYHGVGIPDCIASGQAAARRVLAADGLHGTVDS
ncbi:protoporphyrinogen oxidase [bacterium]|nr:protoporphyrinogen oxidase [bacterium]